MNSSARMSPERNLRAKCQWLWPLPCSSAVSLRRTFGTTIIQIKFKSSKFELCAEWYRSRLSWVICSDTWNETWKQIWMINIQRSWATNRFSLPAGCMRSGSWSTNKTSSRNLCNLVSCEALQELEQWDSLPTWPDLRSDTVFVFWLVSVFLCLTVSRLNERSLGFPVKTMITNICCRQSGNQKKNI